MDKNYLVSKLNKLLPGAVLESRYFGRSSVSSIWVEKQSIYKIASLLNSELEQKFEWLENLSVVELENVLVVSYFVRSLATGECLVMRASAVPTSENAEVLFPSVRSIWPMSAPMEREAFEMFGIRFYSDGSSSSLKEEEVKDLEMNFRILPDDWKGFPLRKNYVFPKEYFGIAHALPFNRPIQKKMPS